MKKKKKNISFNHISVILKSQLLQTYQSHLSIIKHYEDIFNST